MQTMFSGGKASPADAFHAVIADTYLHTADGAMTAVFAVPPHAINALGGNADETLNVDWHRVLNAMPAGVRARFIHRISPDIAMRDIERCWQRERNGNPFFRHVQWERFSDARQAASAGLLFGDEHYFCVSYRPLVRSGHRGKGAPVLPLNQDMVVHAAEERLLDRARVIFENSIAPIEKALGESYIGAKRLTGESLRACVHSLMATGRGAGERPLFPDYRCTGQIVTDDISSWAAFSLRRAGDCRNFRGLLKDLVTHPSCSTSGDRVDTYVITDLVALSRKPQAAASPAPQRSGLTFGALPFSRIALGTNIDAAPVEMDFHGQVTILLRANTQEQIAERKASLADLAAHHAITVTSTLDPHEALEQIRLSHPFWPAEDGNLRSITTSQAVSLIPLYGYPSPADPSGSTLLATSGGRVSAFDWWAPDPRHRNIAVFGRSGSGKSFGAQVALIHPALAEADTEVCIVESGSSYELMVFHAEGKSYRGFATTSDWPTINPLDMPEGFDKLTPREKRELLHSIVTQATSLLMVLCGTAGDSAAERILYKAIEGVCTAAADPRLSDVYAILSQFDSGSDDEPVASRILAGLAPYVSTPSGERGRFARYFDGATTVNTSAFPLRFDLLDDPDAGKPLRLALLLAITEWYRKRSMLCDGKRRILLLDEAPGILGRPATEAFTIGQNSLELLCRDARASMLQVVVIAQYADAVLDMPFLATAMGRRLFLTMPEIEANVAGLEKLNVPAKMQKAIFSLRSFPPDGVEAILTDSSCIPVYIAATPVQYALASSKPTETDLDRMKARYGSLFQGYTAHLDCSALRISHYLKTRESANWPTSGEYKTYLTKQAAARDLFREGKPNPPLPK